MSNRLRRKSRPQGDVEIYGGPLKQTTFKGGINLDRPASEIGDDQLADAQNVICFDRHVEARPGTKKATVLGWSMPGSGTYHNFLANQFSLENASQEAQYILHRGSGLTYLNNPISGSGVSVTGVVYDGSTGSAFGVDGDSTIRPFRKGNVVFTASKLAYLPHTGGWFQLNAANPVYGLPGNTVAANNYIRRYLVTFTRIVDASGAVVTDRRSGYVLHESGVNDNRYYDSGTVNRTVDYAEVYKAAAWSSGSGFNFTNAQLQTIFSSLGSANNNAAASHFTHVSIYGTLDLGSSGLDPESKKGNPRDVYVWLGDVTRTGIFSGSSDFTDNFDDDTLRARMAANGYLLGSRGFQPLPNGAAGEATPGFIFVADRATANKKSTVYYSQIDNSPEHMGYYFPGSQFKDFGDVVVAMRATNDTLSIFCLNSTHTCTLTSWFENSNLTPIFVLNHFATVDETLGVRDWGTIAQVDRTTLIAVCSDASVRTWDTTKWGKDISDDAVNSEIIQIVPANPANTTTGSFAYFHKGGYYLHYSKSSSDTDLQHCIRYGFGGRGGSGWTRYVNWVRLPFRCGVTNVIDDTNRVQRILGINTTAVTNGHRANNIYWLETFETFTGAAEFSSNFERLSVDGKSSGDAGSDTGTEIVCRIKLREFTSSEEADEILHQETHAYFRPQKESVGYRSGFQVSLVGYVNGSTTASETISDIPKTGDWHFTREITGRRIQLEIVTTTAQFRLIGTDSHCRSLDRINYATAGDNTSSESTAGSDAANQLALASNLVYWYTRRNMRKNQVNLTDLTATLTSFSTQTGPDGKSDSAVLLSASQFDDNNLPFTSFGDFTVALSVKFPSNPTDQYVLRIFGPEDFYIHFPSSTSVDVSALGALTISSVSGTGWHHFAFVRSGGTITVYQNGASVGTIAFGSDAVGPDAIRWRADGGPVYFHDIRIYSNAKTATNIAYLYNDIVNYSGDRTLPMV